MGDSAFAQLDDEMAHGFGALAATGQTTEFSRFPIEVGLIGPGGLIFFTVPMPSDSVWTGRMMVAARDAAAGGSYGAHVTFGASNTGGTASVNYVKETEFGTGSLPPTALAIDLGGTGSDFYFKAENQTPENLNVVCLVEVLEIR